MTNCHGSKGIDEVRASILVQVIRKDYLEELVEKAKLLESQFGSDYPHELSRALQEIRQKKLAYNRNHTISTIIQGCRHSAQDLVLQEFELERMLWFTSRTAADFLIS